LTHSNYPQSGVKSGMDCPTFGRFRDMRDAVLPVGTLRGAFAAAVTPFQANGDVAEDAIAGLVELYVAAELDGVMAMGTTGEGMLLSTSERRTVAERFLDAANDRLAVVIHCGAQTTRDTVALADHAAESGATAIAVIPPPYYALDDDALVEHLAAAARACAPASFYLYEFAARSGYAVPLAVIERIRERTTNLVGLKLSDAPLERFAPYLSCGLDVLVGPEALIHEGMSGGAVGAVSALASAFPEMVSELVRSPSPEAAQQVGAVRSALQAFPFQAALKHVLGRRGIDVAPHVRAPLRTMTGVERAALDDSLKDVAWSANDAR